jgi:thiamine biosynthesis lipoprotein
MRLSTYAMGCDFEVYAFGEEELSLRVAAEAAVAEIERVERLLSHYLPDSEISLLNSRAAYESIRVHPDVFELLQRAIHLSYQTQGAFDITVMPLVQCWGFFTGVGQVPNAVALADALRRTGASQIRLDAQSLTVSFLQEGVGIHLGAIGKGYAVDRAIQVLREAGVPAAMVHGGHSSVRAYGSPPGSAGWQVNLPHPDESQRSLARMLLCDRAISLSSLSEQYFEREGHRYGHILDPRTGMPVDNELLLVGVLAAEATVSDALATAFFVMGLEGIQHYIQHHPEIQALVLSKGSEQPLWLSATC